MREAGSTQRNYEKAHRPPLAFIEFFNRIDQERS
jgi:hypothetical protein